MPHSTWFVPGLDAVRVRRKNAERTFAEIDRCRPTVQPSSPAAQQPFNPKACMPHALSPAGKNHLIDMEGDDEEARAKFCADYISTPAYDPSFEAQMAQMDEFLKSE